MEQYAVVHAVLAVEAQRIGIVRGKQVVGVHHGIFYPEEPPDAPLVAGNGPGEAAFGSLTVLFLQLLGHHKLLHAVGAGVEKRHLAEHAVLQYGLAHPESRVHQYAVEAVEHLCIHASHRRADNEVGPLGVANVVQQVHGLGRMYGQVGGHNHGPGQQLAQPGHCARQARRCETVDI